MQLNSNCQSYDIDQDIKEKSILDMLTKENLWQTLHEDKKPPDKPYQMIY